MSEENVQVVRDTYAHFNRVGEPPWELFAAEAQFDASNIPGFGVIQGREQVVATMREYAAAFDGWRIEPEELYDAGEQVVAVVRDGGRLKGTGDEVYNRFAHVWTFRGGQVLRWETFTDKAKALEVAGLSE